MLIEKIKYTDFLGVEKEKDFYFNYSKPEIIDMQIASKEPLSVKMQRIIDGKDNVEIMNSFKDIVLGAVGKLSPDGERFEKSPEISKEFSEHPAYEVLILKFMLEADYVANFVNTVIPDLSEVSAEFERRQKELDAKEAGANAPE